VQSLPVASFGEGVARSCQTSRIGRVVGAFSSGFYVATDQSVFAIGSSTIPAGPIHLRLARQLPLKVAEGSAVILDSNRIQVESAVIKLPSDRRYNPGRPSPESLASIAPSLSGFDAVEYIPDDIIAIWEEVRLAVADADLKTAASLLQGRGMGLTPTGDDALAGLILFVHWANPKSNLPFEVAHDVSSTSLSRSFLIWAAAGQSIEPVHDMIEAATELTSTARSTDRFENICNQIVSIGNTSGRGLLAGLGLAAAHWPDKHYDLPEFDQKPSIPHEQTTAGQTCAKSR